MWKLVMFLLAAAFVSIGSAEVRAQAVNVTGGYTCQGNCALPGRCARAYVDGWWTVNTHVSFYDTAGIWSDGMYVGPNGSRQPHGGCAVSFIQTGSFGFARQFVVPTRCGPGIQAVCSDPTSQISV